MPLQYRTWDANQIYASYSGHAQRSLPRRRVRTPIHSACAFHDAIVDRAFQLLRV
eukprot:COSAG04_NODE_25638_length_305_cov_0.723301_1_plen_54_part_10